jgi:hypothetical protein
MPIGAELSARNVLKRFCARGHCRQFKMGVSRGAAMAWQVLDGPSDPGTGQAIKHRTPQRRHAERLLAIGPVADHIMRARLAHVEDRRMCASYANFGKVCAHCFGIGPCRCDRAGGGELIKLIKCRTRRPDGPVGRL